MTKYSRQRSSAYSLMIHNSFIRIDNLLCKAHKGIICSAMHSTMQVTSRYELALQTQRRAAKC